MTIGDKSLTHARLSSALLWYSASLSLVQNFQRRLCALILMRQSRVLYIYTNSSVLRVTRRSGIAAFRPAYRTVLHTCVKLPSLACRKMENVNELRFRWVRARGHISQKIDGKPQVNKNKKFLEKLYQYLNKL